MPRARKTPTGAQAQPVQVAPGGAYGTRGALEAAQQAVPIAAAPKPGAAPPSLASAAPVVNPMAAAEAHPPPQGVPLSAPTQRPDEPWTAGIDFGPGAGSTPLPVMENTETLRMWMPALERLASMPEASAQTRNLVRFLRSNL